MCLAWHFQVVPGPVGFDNVQRDAFEVRARLTITQDATEVNHRQFHGKSSSPPTSAPRQVELENR